MTRKELPSAGEKLLMVLLLFQEQPKWQLNRLAGRLGLPKSTAHRLLATLKQYQFVSQDPNDNAYMLGFRVWSLASKGRDYDFIASLAYPVLKDLVTHTGETALLTVREGLYSLCIARVDGLHQVRLSIDIGTASPLHLGASNSVLLAFLPKQVRDVTLEQSVPDASARSEVQEELARIQAEGYAYSSSQLTPGAAALGVPVFDREGGLVAGLSIGGPAYRLVRSVALTHLSQMKRAAISLAERLGRTELPLD